MISEIVIRQLHHLYDYDIVLGKTVNILTGPNGYGKTSILNIVNRLLSYEFWYFYFLKFDSIAIHFDDKKRILIGHEVKEAVSQEESNKNEAIEEWESIVISFYMDETTDPVERFVMGRTYMSRIIRRFLPSQYTRIDGPETEEMLDDAYNVDEDSYLKDNAKNILMFLQQQKCLFIKEQRLVDMKAEPISVAYRKFTLFKGYTIADIANNLHREYASYQAAFAEKSQEIDATFIKRLINEIHEEYSEEEYAAKLENLKNRMRDYQRYGLVSQEEVLEVYPEGQRKVLSLYIDDMLRKMEIYRDFHKRLSIFDKFVSGKSLSNKRILLNAKDGISVENDRNEVIPLHKLSSGEQNLIILYYKLAFLTQPYSLMLIDEPEKSLHVEWLQRMLEDYKYVSETLPCQLLIATHSPVFINGEWDLTFDLYFHSKK